MLMSPVSSPWTVYYHVVLNLREERSSIGTERRPLFIASAMAVTCWISRTSTTEAGTFLFQEQFAQGNASLLLQRSGIEDKGRYRCHVHTALGDQESDIIAKVEGVCFAQN